MFGASEYPPSTRFTVCPAATFKEAPDRLLPAFASDPSCYQPQCRENKSHHHNEGHEVQQPSHACPTPMEAYYASIPAPYSAFHSS